MCIVTGLTRTFADVLQHLRDGLGGQLCLGGEDPEEVHLQGHQLQQPAQLPHTGHLMTERDQ